MPRAWDSSAKVSHLPSSPISPASMLPLGLSQGLALAHAHRVAEARTS
jgi:hypothetical protein